MTLGERIRSARLEKGLTQRQVCGSFMTRNMLSQLENGLVSPSVKTLEHLSSVLEIPLSRLLGEEPSAEESFRQAASLCLSGRWQDCIDLLGTRTGALTEEDRYLLVRSYLQKGLQALDAGAYAEARVCAEKAVQISCTYAGVREQYEAAYLLAGCALSEGKGSEKTATLLQKLYDQMGTEAKHRQILALWYMKNGNEALAKRELSLLPEGSFEKAFYGGELLIRSEDYDGGLELLKQAEQIGSERKALMLQLFRALEEEYRRRENYKMAYHYAVRQLQLV